MSKPFVIEHDAERFEYAEAKGALEYFSGRVADDSVSTDIKFRDQDGSLVGWFDWDGLTKHDRIQEILDLSEEIVVLRNQRDELRALLRDVRKALPKGTTVVTVVDETLQKATYWP